MHIQGIEQMDKLNYELLGLLASILALLISLASLIRSRNTQKEFLKFEMIHAELSAKQLQEMKKFDVAKKHANIQIEVIDGSLHLTNISSAVARNVDINFDNEDQNCTIEGELEILPYPQLNSDQEIKLIGYYNTDKAPRTFAVTITWLNEDDSPGLFSGIVQS